MGSNIETSGPRFYDIRREHIPYGISDELFIVEPGIKVFSLNDDCSNAREVEDGALSAMLSSDAATRGVILETVAYGDPVASCTHPEVLEALDSISDSCNVPVLVSSRRAQILSSDTDMTNSPLPPRREYEHVMSAGELRTPEAKVFLAHTLSLAKRSGITSVNDVIAFIRSQLAAHPYSQALFH